MPGAALFAPGTNLSGNGGNALITASKNVKTKSIGTNGGSTVGQVEIRANTGGGGSQFVIGADSGNGIDGLRVLNQNTCLLPAAIYDLFQYYTECPR